MTLSRKELAELLGHDVHGLPAISSITADSRKVQPGSIFVALRGESVDGHDFAKAAAEAGAVAILGDRTDVARLAGLPYFPSPDVRGLLGRIAHRLVGDPSRAMNVVGVTGTNGKSSAVFMIHRVLRHDARRVAHFGTLGYCIGELTVNAAHTTPFAEDLAYMFDQARREGCNDVVMEVSSHALEQERVSGIHFNVGVFTNLTPDHLDYHADMDTYRREKLKLFERIEGERCFTIANVDDPCAQYFVDASRVPCHTYGNKGDIRAEDVRIEARHSRFRIQSPWGGGEVSLRLLGSHNVSNALAAFATCAGLGVPPDRILEGIESIVSVPGRFEHIDLGQDFQVIVDYAHTEDGLRNVLRAAREICSRRLIVVFGCGGDRDKSKRPKMGAAAAELADFAIATSDNPRTESPERILLDIEVGLQRAGAKRDDAYRVILDRRAAIEHAVDMAGPGDVVLIAGKGHEDYQILGRERIHFDDREVARSLLEASRA